MFSFTNNNNNNNWTCLKGDILYMIRLRFMLLPHLRSPCIPLSLKNVLFEKILSESVSLRCLLVRFTTKAGTLSYLSHLFLKESNALRFQLW